MYVQRHATDEGTVPENLRMGCNKKDNDMDESRSDKQTRNEAKSSQDMEPREMGNMEDDRSEVRTKTQKQMLTPKYGE
jgi:hypothetical protein